MRRSFYLRSVRLWAGILLCALALPSATLRAQEITGTISGTVNDTSGGVVPEAKVTLLSENTGVSRKAATNASGVFFFNRLPIGRYVLAVEKAGFKRFERPGVVLNVDDKLNFDIVLQVGAVTEKVTVSAEATPILQTETAEISNLVGAAQTELLPLNGRDFNQLVDLMPGVSPDNGKVNRGTGLFSDTSISVNGGQSNSNMFLLDGQYNLDSGGSGNLLVTPSIDSIEEFKILRNNYSA
jgi:hypothetical protein